MELEQVQKQLDVDDEAVKQKPLRPARDEGSVEAEFPSTSRSKI